MTQADRVLSTPPLRAPINTTRRNLIAQAAAAIAGGALLGATLPLPESAGAAQPSPDPIYALIERHRELSARYDAAVSVSAKLFDGPEWEAAEEVTAAACTALLDFADSLVCSEPTTLAGVIALLRYAAALQEWEIPRNLEVVDVDGELIDWSRAFFATVANALDRIGVRA
jgi:hypothetical protein